MQELQIGENSADLPLLQLLNEHAFQKNYFFPSRLTLEVLLESLKRYLLGYHCKALMKLLLPVHLLLFYLKQFIINSIYTIAGVYVIITFYIVCKTINIFKKHLPLNGDCCDLIGNEVFPPVPINIKQF